MIEYKEVKTEKQLTVEELNNYGKEGWKLAVIDRINEDWKLYIFQRTEPFRLSIFINEIEGYKFSDTKTINFFWYENFFPQIGQAISLLNYCLPKDLHKLKETIENDEVSTWFREDGIDMFMKWQEYEKKELKKDKGIFDYIKGIIDDCIVRQISLDRNYLKQNQINIWLKSW